MKQFFCLVTFMLSLLLTSTVWGQEGFGNVYFIRSTGFQGSAVAFTAFIDNSLVCKLNNKRYSIHEVAAGTHTFSVQFGGKQSKVRAEPITIPIEAGKTYYVQMIFQTGVLKNNLYCQEVTENSAKTVLSECQEDTDCIPENYTKRVNKKTEGENEAE
ncbi:MAG: DUF2846 domain-containing protein [Mangrovibacterium sp.]